MNIAIIGGGAAGMFAAAMLAKKGKCVTIYEKNEKLGKKLFITGKGRCNLTNDTDVDTLLKNVVSNPKFLFSAFHAFSSADTMHFFEENGLNLKTERGNRVFPASDHSSDVIRCLEQVMKKNGVTIMLHTVVTGILVTGEDDKQTICGIEYKDSDGKIKYQDYDYVIVATGGLSYAGTGSTGDGLRFAEQLGITVKECLPSLVPFEIEEPLCKELMGLSLKNVSLSCYMNKKGKDKLLYKEQGEMLFTHFGISGPLVLSASAYAGKYMNEPLYVLLDLKPALTTEQLDARILRDFEQNKNKQIRNALDELLPKKMIPIVLEYTGIDKYKQVNAITKEERAILIESLKRFKLHVSGFRGYDEAIVTKGGIGVKEMNPKTMECKKIKGLYFIGEVLDVDALTGGFNLQIAWSTAAAAAYGIEQEMTV